MQECVPPDVSQQSIGQMSQLFSKANPHPGAGLCVAVMAYLHSLRSCPLMLINLKPYLFSLLWASIHTKLLFPIAGFSKSIQSGTLSSVDRKN